MKKLIIFIIILILAFGAFAIFRKIPKNYEYKYTVDKFDVVEKYDKKNKVYTFNIKNKNLEYDYSIENKYISERGLITKIKFSKECLTVSLDNIKGFSVCQNDDGYYTKYYNDKDESKKSSTYENIDIYDLNNHSYLIWNYNYFIGINKDKKEKISLFDDDFIKLNVVSKYKDKLIVGDYNEDYSFKKFYIIDPIKMKKDTIKIDLPIYLNSYFLGEYDDYLYLFDVQAKQEYKIDIDKGLVYRNKPEVLTNGVMEDSSVIKLSNNQEFFTYKNTFDYILKDNKLYYESPSSDILITTMNVDKIVYQEDKECYFLVGDTLYYVDLDNGIKKLLSYSEWQFNNSNIYIF